MTDFTQIRYDVADSIATITLNRPEKMNAFTNVMMREMCSAFDLVDADDAVRAVIVTGSGERAFCAGADLTPDGGGDVFASGSKVESLSDERVRDSGGRLTLRIFQCKKPVIGAINGAAVGIGATMQLPMDFRLASDTARFGFVFARRGIVPEAASSWFLPRLVGMQTALEWTLTGDLFDANEALRGGLVRSVHAPDDLLPAAYALAKRLSERTSAISVAIARQMMWRSAALDHPMQAHVIDSKLMYQTYQMPDGKDGFAAFLEKRAPVFHAKVSTDLPSSYPWWQEPELK